MPYTDMQLAEAFLQTGELADALDALNRHIDANPHDAEARRLRAALLLRLDDEAGLSTAIDDLETLPEQTPDDVMMLATILGKLGRDEDALTVLQNAHNHHPQNQRLTERLLIALRDDGQVVEAQALVAQQPTGDWRWQSWAGELAAADDDHEAAILHYTAAIDLIRTSRHFSAELSEYFAGSDTMQVTIQGAYARLLLNRAASYQQTAQYELADADYGAAAALLPTDPTIPLMRGIVAWLRDDPSLAEDFCREGLAMASPTMRDHLLNLLADHPDLLAQVQ